MTKETIIDVSKQFRNLQVQYDKVVEQNRELQQELREKSAECEELKQALDKVEEYCNAQDFYVDSTAWNIFKIVKKAKEGEK